MSQIHGSATRRLLVASVSSSVIALFILLVNPFPTDVYGQQPAPGVTTSTVRPGGSTEVLGSPPSASGSGTSASSINSQGSGQQPAALPRTGMGTSADAGRGTSMVTGYGMVVLALAFGAGSLRLHLRARKQ